MLTQLKGELARSNPRTWADGATLDFDLQFLSPYLRDMEAPVIRELLFHFSMGLTAGSGGVTAEDRYNFIQRLWIRDAAGDRVNVGGKVLRVIEQMEVGDHQTEASIASGATPTAHDFFARVVFDTKLAHRGSDFALPVPYLTDGGAILLQCGTPANASSVSGTVRCYARVHDERKREVKSRMVWTERVISQVEDDYMVGGSLRAAIHTSDLGSTTSYSSLAGITQVDSKVLEYPALDPEILRQEYRRIVDHTLASDDEFVASTPNAIGLLVPSKGQHIGKLPDLQSFDYKFNGGSVPTSSRMAICKIEDRSAQLAAKWMRFGSVGEYAAAVKERGMVNAKGGARPVSEFDPKLVRRLPLRIPGA